MTVDLSGITAIVSATLALLAFVIGGFRYMTAGFDAIRREIVAVKDNAQLVADKVGESEAKQRHSQYNAAQALIGRVESDVRTLQREAVSQEQLVAVEARLTVSVGKVESKVDKIVEQVGEITALRTVLSQVTERLGRISDRLDETHGVARNTRA